MHDQTSHSPDFDELDRIAPNKAGRRNLLFALIGNINYSWSNNESTFIYILQHLMQTDELTATLVFGTLNTTRARLELIERLADAKLKNVALKKKLRRILRIFNESTRLRNEFSHATFKQNQQGEITHTHSMRIQRKNGQIQLGEIKAVDDARITQMGNAIEKLVKLNREIWAFLPELQQAMTHTTETEEGQRSPHLQPS
ncbi:hypothetical protein PsAD13_04722 [Pseudovibrio sp. Ad13]|uniref:hypothetical protein n=1 Tax=unclassified Pseudovibrio TaxID=2627060 RepID=UPI0007AE806F|nr:MULTISPECIES: hypothetical protein [unclassified Pseudovibrio]KZK77245.1 hypothetical protein PsAD46_05074 [Pseudovibrio sp. Ad46]KZK80657.1 hypothetical protein PsAD13_04722 [Pseudovibrio sp. Ad13]